MSKDELLSKLRESGISIVNDSDLPQRTKFTETLSDLLFDDSRTIQVLSPFAICKSIDGQVLSSRSVQMNRLQVSDFRFS